MRLPDWDICPSWPTPLDNEPVPSPHERHFGDAELIAVQLDSLISLSQIRNTANSRLEELVESIDSDGLDNPVNVARLNRDELADYIQFTNNTWGSAVRVDDYDGLQQPDGRYNLLVAGHSRVEAIRTLALRHEAETGQATNYTVQAKLLQDNSVESIVAKQAAENLHASVTQERSAMAIVELYTQGLGTKWGDAESFYATQKHRLNRRMLRDALAFAQLEPPIRNTVFAGYIPYKAGVELGRSAMVVRRWFETETGQLTLPDAETNVSSFDRASLEEATGARIRYEAAYIANHGLNSTAATRHIRAYVAKMQKEIEARVGTLAETGPDASGRQGLFTMVSAAQQAWQIARRERTRLARQLRETGNSPLAKTADLIITLTDGMHGEELTEVMQDLQGAQLRLGQQLTRQTVRLHAAEDSSEARTG
jgi:hypothetical protein